MTAKKAKSITTRAEFETLAQQAVAEFWQAEGTPEQVKESILNQLFKLRDALVTGIIGIHRDTWGDVKLIDYIPGRNGYSERKTVAQTYLESNARQQAVAWLTEQAFVADALTITSDEYRKLVKAFHKAFMEELNDAVVELAHHAAESAAETIVAHAIGEIDLVE